MREQSSTLIDHVENLVGRKAAEEWWELSRETHRVAGVGDPTAVTRRLAEAAAFDPGSPLSPAYELWAADALMRAAGDRESIEVFDRAVMAAESAPAFDDIDFGGEALRHKVSAHSRLGDLDAAVETGRELAKRGEWESLYQAAAALEHAGRSNDAALIYREIAEGAKEAAAAVADRAARAARRLVPNAGVFTPSPLGIAEAVADAVLSRDAGALRRLASPTHFQAGPGAGHLRFEDDEVLDWLCADLTVSRPQRLHRGLRGTGGKRYLLTSGWQGRRFEYIVGFYFTRSGRGWSWDGVLVTAPSRPWIERWAPIEPRSNQPLDLAILSPWPAGRHFTAGGLSGFIWDSAVLAALAAIPIVGPGLAAARAFLYSLATCGFGLRGFYYNAGPTHTGDDAFAIDFSTYRRGIPFSNASGGTRVLAVADGTVRWTQPNVPSGETWGVNEVQINHLDVASAKVRYVSRYLHLAGPGLVAVSAGMPAPTGMRLGVMNDTGDQCVIDHLHFSLHDSWAGSGYGPSVRPSPMDAQVLDDDDSGACLRSTNGESLPSGCGAIVADLIRRVSAG